MYMYTLCVNPVIFHSPAIVVHVIHNLLAYLKGVVYRTSHTCSECVNVNLQVLWPYLLEFLVPVQYMRAVSIVSRCIADIAKKKREAEADDYELNFDELSECIHCIYLAAMIHAQYTVHAWWLLLLVQSCTVTYMYVHMYM